MNRKSKIIIVFLFILVVITGIIINVKNVNKETQEDEQNEDKVSQEPLEPENFGLDIRFPTVSEEQIPQGETIKISEVEMANFVQKKGLENKYGEVKIASEEGLVINYFLPDESFHITVMSPPFFQRRIQAENKFLEELNISQEEACQLNVSITTPRFANPDEAGKVYPLSFCDLN